MWLNPQEIRIWSDLLTGEFLNRKIHFLRSVSYDIGKKFIAKIFYKFIVYFQKKKFFYSSIAYFNKTFTVTNHQSFGVNQ